MTGLRHSKATAHTHTVTHTGSISFHPLLCHTHSMKKPVAFFADSAISNKNNNNNNNSFGFSAAAVKHSACYTSCVCVCLWVSVCVCFFKGTEEKWANRDNGREYNLHCAILHVSLEGCNCRSENLLCVYVCFSSVEVKIAMGCCVFSAVYVHAYAQKK